ncbi:MAG: type II toxin-antitoxin system Phd/YefM family antitoxin [Verrucomicrobia bacterium]|nr:type II toxin-antitoxin system Phd/YefM family antitoxin [Verrucomicrobiota bacterium]
MKIAEDIRPVTYLKAQAASLLEQVNKTHRPVVITQSGEPRAVLQDPESYEQMRNAMGILKLIAQGEQDIRAGRVRLQREVFERLDCKLKMRGSRR